MLWIHRAAMVCVLVAMGCGDQVVIKGDPGAGGTSSSGVGAAGQGGNGAGDVGGGGEAGSDAPCGCPADEVCNFGVCEPRRLVRVDVLQIDYFLSAPDALGAAFIQAVAWSGDPIPDPPEYTMPPSCGYKVASAGHTESIGLDLGDATLHIAGGPTLSFPPLVDGASDLWNGFPLDPGVDVFELATTGGVDVEPFSVTFEQPEPIVVDPLPPLVPGEPWTVTWSGQATDVLINLTAMGEGLVQCFGEGPSSVTIPGDLTTMVVPGDSYGVELFHFGERKIDKLPSGVGVLTHPYRWHRLVIDASAP